VHDNNGSLVTSIGYNGTIDITRIAIDQLDPIIFELDELDWRLHQIINIKDVVVDSSGFIYAFLPNRIDTVSDGKPFDLVFKFDNNGTFLNSWGLNVTKEGQQFHPTDIAIDNFDNIYLLANGVDYKIEDYGIDLYNIEHDNVEFFHVIQKFDQNGTFIDGIKTKGDVGIEFDSHDDMYIIDRNKDILMVYSNESTSSVNEDLGSSLYYTCPVFGKNFNIPMRDT
jgi:hypothetical protein